jgi:hypothetical protein
MNNKKTLLERAPTKGHLTNETCSELTAPQQQSQTQREREKGKNKEIDRVNKQHKNAQ